MHHWTVHEKVDFLKFPRDTMGGGGDIYSTTFDPEHFQELKSFGKKFYICWTGGVYSTTFDAELRNERFTLISFIGFPAIFSTLQPFEICIFNRK